MMKKTTYVGIDLGKSGGIVAIRGRDIIHQSQMPLVADTDVDVMKILKLLQGWQKEGDIHVIMERFSGFFGYAKSAVASLARQSGMVEAMCKVGDIPFTRVPPKTWQTMLFEGTQRLSKKSKDGADQRDTKKMALVVASTLYPKETWLPTPRHTKPHDGIVDAALLATYGVRKGF